MSLSTLNIAGITKTPLNNQEQIVLAQAIRAYEANARAVRAHTKTRGQVRGGGRKPWRQKGTGRARVGSIRSPLWRGGGIIFGPTKDRNFKQKLNQKHKLRALALALQDKQANQAILQVTAWPQDGKTKSLAKLLDNQAKIYCLVVSRSTPAVTRMAHNLKNVHVILARDLNSWQASVADILIFDSKAAAIVANRLQGITKKVARVNTPKSNPVKSKNLDK